MGFDAKMEGYDLVEVDGRVCLFSYMRLDADADIPTTTLTEADLQDGSIDILGLLVKSGLSASRSEARRSVEQGGVSVNGEKVTDVKTQYAGEDLQGEGITLKRGKKSFKKIVMA